MKKLLKNRLMLSLLHLLFAIFLICNIAEASSGRVVTVDGIGGLLTAIDPL